MTTPNDDLPFFDAAEGARRRDDSIERVESHADPEALDEVLATVRAVCLVQRRFTTDAVWRALPPGLLREPRAMGAVMRRAQARGYCAPVEGGYSPSLRPVAHRNPKRVWASRLVGELSATA